MASQQHLLGVDTVEEELPRANKKMKPFLLIAGLLLVVAAATVAVVGKMDIREPRFDSLTSKKLSIGMFGGLDGHSTMFRDFWLSNWGEGLNIIEIATCSICYQVSYHKHVEACDFEVVYDNFYGESTIHKVNGDCEYFWGECVPFYGEAGKDDRPLDRFTSGQAFITCDDKVIKKWKKKMQTPMYNDSTGRAWIWGKDPSLLAEADKCCAATPTFRCEAFGYDEVNPDDFQKDLRQKLGPIFDKDGMRVSGESELINPSQIIDPGHPSWGKILNYDRCETWSPRPQPKQSASEELWRALGG